MQRGRTRPAVASISRCWSMSIRRILKFLRQESKRVQARRAGGREPDGLPTPGWLRHIRDGSAAADAQKAVDLLTGDSEGASSFPGGVAGELAPGDRCRTSPWFFAVSGIAGSLPRSARPRSVAAARVALARASAAFALKAAIKTERFRTTNLLTAFCHSSDKNGIQAPPTGIRLRSLSQFFTLLLK